jgi:hypothetical protein
LVVNDANHACLQHSSHYFILHTVQMKAVPKYEAGQLG